MSTPPVPPGLYWVFGDTVEDLFIFRLTFHRFDRPLPDIDGAVYMTHHKVDELIAQAAEIVERRRMREERSRDMEDAERRDERSGAVETEEQVDTGFDLDMSCEVGGGLGVRAGRDEHSEHAA
ncbi:hypothetical protein NX059_002744 [Plenodomus lindquistii]|nr:hypothetical protein NX059_002744 [Plenodomus lindquistii]